MVIHLHDDQLGQVRPSNILSWPFKITNGLKQGCVLALTLFTLFCSMMRQQVTEDLDDKDGVYIRFRTDGSLFNLRHLQANTKVKDKLIRELLFTDEAVLVAHTESPIQRITCCFAEAACLLELDVSLKKTEVLHQSVPQEEYHPPSISIEPRMHYHI